MSAERVVRMETRDRGQLVILYVDDAEVLRMTIAQWSQLIALKKVRLGD